MYTLHIFLSLVSSKRNVYFTISASIFNMGNKAAVIYSLVKDMDYKFPIRVYFCHINGKRDHRVLTESEPF